MHADNDVALLPLLIVVLLSFAVPLILGRIRAVRVPIAVGEILAGMLVGKSGLNLVQTDSTLQLLNFLGLAALMFVSGLEIDFDLLRGRSRNGSAHRGQSWRERLYRPVALAVLCLAFTLVGAWFFAARLEESGFVGSGPLLALLIGTAALTMAVPVLKEADLMATRFGQTLLATAVVGDFVTMVAITIGVSLYSGGFSLQTLLVLGLLAAVLVVYRAGRALQRFNLTAGLAGGTVQIGVRASFAAMLVFVALAQSLGAEVVLGAFLAGVLMALLSGPARKDVSHKLDALGFGFLIPVFFLMVGINFDFRVLLGDRQALLFVPVLLGVTFLVRGLPPALLLLPFHGLRQALAGGILTAAQMSVTIAASNVVLRAGAISESIHAAIILVVIILAVLTPVLFSKLLPPQVAAAEQLPVLVAGANPLALRVAQRLARRVPVRVVDPAAERVAAAQRLGLTAVQADVTDGSALLAATGAQGVRAAVALTGDDAVNVAAAQAMREALGADPVYALVRDTGRWEAARAAGVPAINPELSSLALIEELVLDPVTAHLLVDGSDSIGLFDVHLHNQAYINRRLRDISLPAGVLVAAIHRGGHKLIPHGETVLAAGDVLTVVAERDQEELVRRDLG